MLARLRQQRDHRQPLRGLFDRQPGKPPPAFSALQRSLHACHIEMTQTVVREASRLAEQQPALTVGEFAAWLHQDGSRRPH